MKICKAKILEVLASLFCRIIGLLERVKAKWLILLRIGRCNKSDAPRSAENPHLAKEKPSPSAPMLPRERREYVCTLDGQKNPEAIISYLLSHGIHFRITRRRHQHHQLHLRCSPQQFRIFESQMAEYLLPVVRIAVPHHILRKLQSRTFSVKTPTAQKRYRKRHRRHRPSLYDFRPRTGGPHTPNQPRKKNKPSHGMPADPGYFRFAVRKAG